jgi:hypothetical protein
MSPFPLEFGDELSGHTHALIIGETATAASGTQRANVLSGGQTAPRSCRLSARHHPTVQYRPGSCPLGPCWEPCGDDRQRDLVSVTRRLARSPAVPPATVRRSVPADDRKTDPTTILSPSIGPSWRLLLERPMPATMCAASGDRPPPSQWPSDGPSCWTIQSLASVLPLLNHAERFRPRGMVDTIYWLIRQTDRRISVEMAKPDGRRRVIPNKWS